MKLFDISDLTAEFTVIDVVLVLLLSFLTSAFIGWVYQKTHRGTSYSQSFVFTLVMNGMIVALVMMIVGSNIARAFSMVGALSIIRFRNAVKETRDVGFIFFTMAVGMAIGTQFYVLGVIAALVISLVVFLMTKFNLFARELASQILSVQVPNDAAYDGLFDTLFLRYTTVTELISINSVQNGTMTELVYNIGMKHADQVQEFVAEIRKLNGNNKVSLIAGYNTTDL
ncbi:MAG: DUF4956 domain-containing protein [Anaerolineae bacterium]|jgi:uncharacterized membrane protein YhiD involved in acid resistance|nr:DUF4956 domain-containing protein [Anaerolineae bacterium]